MQDIESKGLLPGIKSVFSTRLKEGVSLKKFVFNIGWYFFDKVITLLVGFFISIWMANYFGATQYGMYNYAAAFVGLFGAFLTLGLDNFVVKDFVDAKEEDKGKILGSNFVLRFLGGMVSFLLILIISIISNGTTVVFWMIVIYSIKNLFNGFSVIDLYFQSKSQFKYSALPGILSFLISTIFRIYLLLSKANLYLFVVALALDPIIQMLILAIFYKKKELSFNTWKVDKSYLKQLIKTYWPAIIAVVLSVVSSQLGSVFVRNLISDSALGVYSVTTKLADMINFVPTVISTVSLPIILAHYRDNKVKYSLYIHRFYGLMTWLGLILAMGIIVITTIVVNNFYGEEYKEAIQYSYIYSFNIFFLAQNIANSIWIIAEKQQNKLIIVYALGLSTTVVLNFVLIPLVGVYGAAITTVVTSFVMAYIAPTFVKELRPTLGLLIKSYNPFLLIRDLGKIIKDNF